LRLGPLRIYMGKILDCLGFFAIDFPRVKLIQAL
jgi:hypothetical protein